MRPLPSNELRLISRSVIKIVAFISMENNIYDGNGESIEPRWNGLSTSEKEELAGLELKRTTQWRPGPPRGRQGRWYEASLIRPCACCKNFPGAGSSTRVIHSWIKIAPVALRSACTSQNRNYARRGEGVPLDCPSTFNADRTRKNAWRRHALPSFCSLYLQRSKPDLGFQTFNFDVSKFYPDLGTGWSSLLRVIRYQFL